jgi:hypothetical protein
MIKNNDSGSGDPKINGDQRPALDARERDVLGARLRNEHGEIVREQLPPRIRALLEKLAQKGPADNNP